MDMWTFQHHTYNPADLIAAANTLYLSIPKVFIQKFVTIGSTSWDIWTDGHMDISTIVHTVLITTSGVFYHIIPFHNQNLHAKVCDDWINSIEHMDHISGHFYTQHP